jgi:hypothetical protein
MMGAAVSRLRIIVAGMVSQFPVGGVAWDYLQYVVGLARLGHDVYYYEDTWCWPYDPIKRTITDDPRYSANFLKCFFEKYAPELRDHWCYLHLHETSCGMSRQAFEEVARTADMFLNVSGTSFFPETLSGKCIKIFVDTDPGYNQIVMTERPAWSENVERWCADVLAHDRHFTYGENIGSADCVVPDAGICWQKTRMPIVLEFWDGVPVPKLPVGAWSTVMTWNVFRGKLLHRNIEYHGKGVEFDKIISLPRHLRQPFRAAVGGTKAPVEELIGQGWTVEDGPAATVTPQAYQHYLTASRGEVSVAKHVYVALRTGWFSCRSACYLAAARPVVVQDTGFTGLIPAGKGLHVFTDSEGAADEISMIERDYAREARAARELAHAYFDSRKVLAKLINDAVVAMS